MPTAREPAPSSRRVRWIVGALVAAGALGMIVVIFVGAGLLPWEKRATLVGDASCIACHQPQAGTYRQTAHALTSSPASAETVHGNFEAGADVFQTGNPDLHFKMEARDGGVFQTAVVRNQPDQVLTHTERMDIVIGSGRKGQTYLYWDDNELYQLPVSFWAEHRVWVNSPGYVDGRARFSRPIGPRCLECHGTSFESQAPPINAYDRSSLVLGISCEKCHGPGSTHVARYRSANPPESVADAAIINPARLPRERQTDLCALCHAGEGIANTPPLSFAPGDVLADHLIFPRQGADALIDVHASQVQLMERSRCFQASSTMTCITCHDVHQPERNLAAMAAKCLQCHQVEDCGEFPVRSHAIAPQCVTCHMPLEKTAKIVIEDGIAPTIRPNVRNHQIAIYPDVDLADE